MQAKDIMSSPVITVTPQTPLHEVVQILIEHRISGVPVVEEGRVVGVLGDGDLLHRHEIGTDGWRDYRSWWQRLTQPLPGPEAYVRSHGAHVHDVMRRDVVSVREDASVAELVALFEKRHIRRVPVLRGEALVGLVTRADLVRALATNSPPLADPQAVADDEAIHRSLSRELGQQPWWSDSWSSLFVEDGVVTYVGVVQSLPDKEAARVAAENTPGVKAVIDRRTLQAEWQPMF